MSVEPKYTPKSELTLSAGPEDGLDHSGALTEAITTAEERALAAIDVPIYSERDPAIIPEAELRLLWGDR